jgi:hypothetical protein
MIRLICFLICLLLVLPIMACGGNGGIGEAGAQATADADLGRGAVGAVALS